MCQELEYLADAYTRHSFIHTYSNFPCKGYQVDVGSKAHAQATLKAGQSFTAKFAPNGATHGGGSCQFALSYDGGKSFGVLHSVIGGCPLKESYTFTVPSGLPAGKDILFGWSWMNKVGNREFYQNCAAVNVESSSTGSMTVPRIFEANIFGAGTCNTVEGDEVVFPNPGDSVEYGGKWAGQKPGKDALQLTNCGGDKLAGENSFVTFSSNGSPPSGSDNAPAPKPPASSSPVSEVKPSPAPEPSPSSPAKTLSLGRPTRVTVTTRQAAGSAPSSAPVTVDVQVPDSTPSNKPSLSLSRNTDRKPLPFSSSGAAKVSSTPATSGGADSCTGSGLKCLGDGSSFATCSNGVWTDMGKSFLLSEKPQITLTSVINRQRRARDYLQRRCYRAGASFFRQRRRR